MPPWRDNILAQHPALWRGPSPKNVDFLRHLLKNGIKLISLCEGVETGIITMKEEI